MLKLGTRGSRLALTQAQFVATQLAKQGIDCHIEVIQTRGDQEQQVPLRTLSGTGFFTKELEQALLEEHIDIAVHSMKDVPTTQPEGLCLGAVLPREDARDCLLVHPDKLPQAFASQSVGLPLLAGAKVGTSALRRQTQLQDLRPDIVVAELRGNVTTRVDRLRQGHFDAIVLAQAGLDRMQLALHPLVHFQLPVDVMVPSPAQGALALQIRNDASQIATAVSSLHHHTTAECVALERALLAALAGGCHLPLGVYVTHISQPKGIRMHVFLAQEGKVPLRLLLEGATSDVCLAQALTAVAAH